jgi:hypothetical protein
LENIVSTADSEIRPVLGRPGISLERAHSGRVSIRNCDLRGFPDPAIDGAGHSGSVLIADSYFENNASSIRIGNHESGIERCKIRVAELPAGAPTANGEQFHINGIAVAQDENRTRHQNNASSLTIADTTIRIDTVPNFCPAIVISSAGSPLILENVDIEFNNDGRAVILGRTPGAESQSGIRPLRMRDLSIVGEGIVDSAIVLKNTDSVRIHDSTLVMLNGNADGITIADSDGITIEETGVQVTDRALVATGTDGTIHQLSPDPDCSDRESTECGSGKFPDAVYQATVEQTEHSADKRVQLAGTLESLSIRGDTGVSFAKRNGKQ